MSLGGTGIFPGGEIKVGDENKVEDDINVGDENKVEDDINVGDENKVEDNINVGDENKGRGLNKTKAANTSPPNKWAYPKNFAFSWFLF